MDSRLVGGRCEICGSAGSETSRSSAVSTPNGVLRGRSSVERCPTPTRSLLLGSPATESPPSLAIFSSSFFVACREVRLGCCIVFVMLTSPPIQGGVIAHRVPLQMRARLCGFGQADGYRLEGRIRPLL